MLPGLRRTASEKVGPVGEVNSAEAQAVVTLAKSRVRSPSIEVHRGLQAVLDLPQRVRRKAARLFGQLAAVQRGHLMAHGKARFRQTGRPPRKRNDSRPALRLR